MSSLVQMREQIIQLANREGDEQFEAMINFTINGIIKQIERNPGSFFPESQMANFDLPHMLKYSHVFEDQTPTAETLSSDGILILPRYPQFKKMDSLFVSVDTPDNYIYKLTQVKYKQLLEEYGAPVYGTESPSSYAKTGIPEKYAVVFDTNTDDSNLKGDYRYIKIVVRPLPTTESTYYCAWSYYRYSRPLNDDDDSTWLSSNFPEVLIYGSLYRLALTYKNIGDIQGYRQIFKEALNGLMTFVSEIDVSDTPLNLNVVSTMEVI